MATKARPTRPAPALGDQAVAPHPAELWLCQAAVAVGGLLFLRSSREIFNLGRMTALLLLAVALAGMLATSLRRPLGRRPSGQALVVGAFAAAVLLAWLLARPLSLGFYGPYARQTGAGLYLGGVLLFLAMARQRGELAARALLGSVAVASGIAVAFGLLQVVGADPFDWPGATLGKVFSTFGQVNFAAGYVGIVTPVLVYFALRLDVAPPLRLASAAAAVGGAVVAVETRSFQGLVALVVGLVPIAAFLLKPSYERLPRQRRVLGLVAFAAVVLVVGLFGAGFLRSQLSSGFRERTLLWRAGLDMVSGRPILGRGFGAFVDGFFQHRPAEHAVRYGLNGADAPHSVPLEMLVNGGIVLFAAYVAFVAWTARALWQAVRLRGDLLVATVAGAWLAYQVQSIVSLDVPPLLILHFVLAGAIVVLSRPEPVARRGGRFPALDWAPVGVGLLLVLLVAWPLTAPLRADLLAHRGEERITSGKAVEAGVADLERAYGIHHTGDYAADLATQLLAQGHVGRAVEAGRQAVAASPGAVQYIVTLGKLELVAGQVDEAHRTFERAVRENPHDALMVTDIADRYVLAGNRAEALRYYKLALTISPRQAVWLQLSRYYDAIRNERAAEDARARAAKAVP